MKSSDGSMGDEYFRCRVEEFEVDGVQYIDIIEQYSDATIYKVQPKHDYRGHNSNLKFGFFSVKDDLQGTKSYRDW